MQRSPPEEAAATGGEVIDFDAALLRCCPPDELAALMREAVLLARAFEPDGRAAQIEALAGEVRSGVRNLEHGRRHAVRLAAALRQLAKAAED